MKDWPVSKVETWFVFFQIRAKRWEKDRKKAEQEAKSKTPRGRKR